MKQETSIEEIAARYVADLPPSTDCAFNVAKKGQHRFCSRMGRKPVGRYYFCQHHAEVVAKAVLDERPSGPALFVMGQCTKLRATRSNHV